MISTHTTFLQGFCSVIAGYEVGYAVGRREYLKVVNGIREYLKDEGITCISFSEFQKLTSLPYYVSRYILTQELKEIKVTNIKP